MNPSKEERKRLLIEMMKEDEKYGMYEKSDNELIAEFMGEEISSVSANFGEPIRVFVLPRKPISVRKTGRSIEARYDTSWDWLMLVVEKIEGLTIMHSIQIYSNHCAISVFNGGDRPTYRYQKTLEGTSKIDATYKAVVQFIKWLNSQQHERI